MFCEDVCLGTTCGIDKLRAISDALSSKVVDQLNGNQELVMLTDFAREANEYQYKKCLQDRISDIASWHWVLEDLSKRLQESIDALKYEHNALRVVVDRVKSEMNCLSNDSSRRGAICPLTDAVEEAIMEEYNYLRDQKKYFENVIEELDKKTAGLEEIKMRINSDILNKKRALTIEETSLNNNYENFVTVDRNTNRKKGLPMARWVKRCDHLKKSGLKALCNAVITRKQVRGARIQLSFSAQAYSVKVEVALRRRLHTNKIKLQDLNWQREEAVRDYNSLQEELTSAEITIMETMNQERVVESRLGDRAQRPLRELTKDDVNRTLREEREQLRRFLKELRNNINKIVALQNKIDKAIANIDCCAEDLIQVISLDEERILYRQGGPRNSDSVTMATATTDSAQELRGRVYSDQLTVTTTTTDSAQELQGRVYSDQLTITTATTDSAQELQGRVYSDQLTFTTNTTDSTQELQGRVYSDQLTVIQEEDEDDYPFDI